MFIEQEAHFHGSLFKRTDTITITFGHGCSGNALSEKRSGGYGVADLYSGKYWLVTSAPLALVKQFANGGGVTFSKWVSEWFNGRMDEVNDDLSSCNACEWLKFARLNRL